MDSEWFRVNAELSIDAIFTAADVGGRAKAAAADPFDLRLGMTDRTHADEARSASQTHLEIVHFMRMHC